MPLHWQQKEADIKIAIWQITEPEDFFLREAYFVDPESLKKYTHAQSRIHWLASRLLLHRILGSEAYATLTKDKKGRPISADGQFQLSISHSEALVAVAISHSETQVGIDIQQFSPKLERIASKYIPADQLPAADHPHYQGVLHVHWGIKEAVYKAYGRGKLDFIQHIRINWDGIFKGQEQAISVCIKKQNTELPFLASYQAIFKDYLLCVVTNASS